MSDNEVCEKFLEAKEWGKIANTLKQSKEKIEEVVGLDIDEKELTGMKDDVERSIDIDILTTKKKS